MKISSHNSKSQSSVNEAVMPELKVFTEKTVNFLLSKIIFPNCTSLLPCFPPGSPNHEAELH